MTPDQINSAFEFAGAAAALFNIVALLRHREVRGVSINAVACFTLWGVWNIWYYPHLGQTWSGVAACALVFTNGVWLALVVYLKNNNRERAPCSYLND